MTLIVELDIAGMVKRAWKEWQIVQGIQPGFYSSGLPEWSGICVGNA